MVENLGFRVEDGCGLYRNSGRTPDRTDTLGPWLLDNPLPRILLSGAVVFGSTLGNYWPLL